MGLWTRSRAIEESDGVARPLGAALIAFGIAIIAASFIFLDDPWVSLAIEVGTAAAIGASS